MTGPRPVTYSKVWGEGKGTPLGRGTKEECTSPTMHSPEMPALLIESQPRPAVIRGLPSPGTRRTPAGDTALNDYLPGQYASSCENGGVQVLESLSQYFGNPFPGPKLWCACVYTKSIPHNSLFLFLALPLCFMDRKGPGAKIARRAFPELERWVPGGCRRGREEERTAAAGG